MSENRFGKDRFDLEHAMNDIRTTATDIQTVADMMYDSSLIYDDDRRHTVLSGLAEVLEAKCEKAEQVFKMVFELDEYAPREVRFDEYGNYGENNPPVDEAVNAKSKMAREQFYKDDEGTLRWKDTDQPLESQLWDKV